MKQLKKSDLLSTIQQAAETSEAPLTKGQIVDLLDEYEFLDSWLTYLLDHFEKQGKIVKEENEDGEPTWAAKAKKTASSNGEVYRVVEIENEDEEGEITYDIEVGKISEVPVADESWSKTKNRAVKKACSAIFAEYKSRTGAIKSLLETEGSDEEE